MVTSANAIGLPQFPESSSTGGILGKDDFLKLLVMQLRYQDPLNPVKGTEFAAQLAQFSSVEQLSNINTNLLQSLDASQILSQSIGNSLAATVIGRDIRASGEAFSYTAAADARIGYTLFNAADSVTVKIMDSSGNVVRTMRGTGTAKGDNTVTWDGKDDMGKSAPAGTYSFTVEAKDRDGGVLEVERYMFGSVTAVRFKSDGAVFVVDGMEIRLSNVLEILEG